MQAFKRQLVKAETGLKAHVKATNGGSLGVAYRPMAAFELLKLFLKPKLAWIASLAVQHAEPPSPLCRGGSLFHRD